MDFLELIKVVVLGIVQSITEWLPISSTGHMLLVDELIHLNVTPEFKELFLVVIQLGSILAVVVLYFNKLNPFNPRFSKEKQRKTWVLWSKVLIGCIPAGIVGVLFDDQIDALFYNNVLIIAIALIVYGILYILLEERNKKRTPRVSKLDTLSYGDAIKIGCFQMLALIPGTSRSGSTILGGIILGIDRYVAAEFSFFLAVPVMAGASLLKILKFGLSFTFSELVIMLVGMLVAFVGSLLVIRFLLNYVRNHDFKIFGWYRIILGILVIVYFFFLK